MAALSVTNGTLQARLWAQDTSTTLPGLTDANYLSIGNDWYMTWYRSIETRASRIASFQVLANGELEGLSSATSVVPDILGLEIALTPLERMEYAELRQLRVKDSTTGTPTRYAMVKDNATEKWLVSYHPIPNGAFTVTALVRVYPIALTTGSDVTVLGDAESYWLWRLVAADAVVLLKRPELRDFILAPIPDAIRRKLGVEAKRLDPKRRPDEALVA